MSGMGKPAPTWQLDVHGHTLGSLATDAPSCLWEHGSSLQRGLSVCLSQLVSPTVSLGVSLWVSTCV